MTNERSKPSRLVHWHRRLVRGEARGIASFLARGLLFAASIPYSIGVRARNLNFDFGLSKSRRADVPVFSIGNLTVGGVGKTPFVETIVRWLIELERTPVIISRGYGSDLGPNDEALLLKENLPSTPHLQNPDRFAAAKEAVAKGLGDAIVLDDGFQHRRLHRDLDIVLVDATDPFGGDKLLPAGFLREPISSLKRADAVVLTRIGSATQSARDEIQAQVRKWSPNAVWAEVDFMPTAWRQFGSNTHPLETLDGKRILAFCGIGNPEAFRLTLDGLKLNIVELHPFPDHHRYEPSDLAFLADRARSINAEAIVATQKDAVKIPQPAIDGFSLYSLGIETQFRVGEEALKALLKQLLLSQKTPPPAGGGRREAAGGGAEEGDR